MEKRRGLASAGSAVVSSGTCLSWELAAPTCTVLPAPRTAWTRSPTSASAGANVVASLNPGAKALSQAATAARKAAKLGRMAAAKAALRVAVRATVKKLVKKAKRNLKRYIKKQVRELKSEIEDEILEGGAEAVAAKVAAAANTDLAAVAHDFISAVDPTGLYDVVNSFGGGKRCRDLMIDSFPEADLDESLVSQTQESGAGIKYELKQTDTWCKERHWLGNPAYGIPDVSACADRAAVTPECQKYFFYYEPTSNCQCSKDLCIDAGTSKPGAGNQLYRLYRHVLAESGAYCLNRNWLGNPAHGIPNVDACAAKVLKNPHCHGKYFQFHDYEDGTGGGNCQCAKDLCFDVGTTVKAPSNYIYRLPAWQFACPTGYPEKGELGADIPGCGLQACSDRALLDTVEACAKQCTDNSQCRSFNYSPADSDSDPRICTMYTEENPTGTCGNGQTFCSRSS